MENGRLNEIEPIAGLFADLKAADRAARGLIALGLSEDQIEIVDLTRLIAEYSPEFASQMAIGTSGTQPTDLDEELIESFGRKIIDEIHLPLYLVDTGLSEHAAAYYAGKIHDGFALLVAAPDEERVLEAKRLVNDMKMQNPNGINKPLPT